MTTVPVVSALDCFIADATPTALALHGSWGRGKTTLWQRRVAEARSAGRLTRSYAYLSLFGLNSISEVRTELYLVLEAAAAPAPAAKQPLTLDPRKLWRRRARLTKDALSVTADAELDTGLGATMTGAVRAWARRRLKNVLICLDDLERRGRDLRVLDVLGLVNELVTTRNCSVALIFNDASLGEGEAEWSAHHEKVFTQEVHFAPDAATCVGLILPDGAAETQELREALIGLGVTNLRVVQRALAFWRLANQASPRPLAAATRHKVANSVALLTFAHLGAGEGAPPIRAVVGFASMAHYMRMQNQEVPPQERAWARQLDTWGIPLDHDLDAALARLVTHGHVDDPTLHAALDDYEGVGDEQQARAGLDAAWAAYGGTFDDNRDEVIRQFDQNFTRLAGRESARQLDAIAGLLRRLSADDVADRLIETWLGHRVGARVGELEPSELNEWEPISDPVLIRRAAEQRAAFPRPAAPLQDAFDTLSARQGYSPEHVQAFAAVTVEELEAFVRRQRGRRVAQGVKSVLELTGDESAPRAVANMRDALRRIGAESSYQAERVARIYGVRREE